jgi:hypothetical protein
VNSNAGQCFATGVNLGTPTLTGCGSLVVTNNAPAQFPIGNTNVTWTVTRGAQSATCVQTVTVRDNQNPVSNHPTDMTLCKSANDTYSIPVNAATDNCGTPSVSYNITGATTRSGSGGNASGIFNVGSSQINWIISDSYGNTITTTTTVVVITTCVVNTRPANNGSTANAPITKGLPVLNMSVQAYPNPSESFFNVKVTSPVKETVELRMFDMLGKVIEMRRGAPDQVFRFGDGAAAGMYIIEARQAGMKEKATIKVVKQN